MEDEKQPGSPVPNIPNREGKPHLTTRYLRLNRLPTLQEVLDRRTRPPLDLFCFYIFLQRESAEDALDFWLDVQQHENLCKAYFKDLKRSGRNIDDDWPEFASYARINGTHFAPLLGNAEIRQRPETTSPLPPVSPSVPGSTQVPNSPHDRGDYNYTPPPLPTAGSSSTPLGSPTLSLGRERRDTESHGPRPPISPVNQQGEFGQGQGDANANGVNGTNAGRGTMSRISMRGWSQRERRSKAPTIIQRDRAIEKTALVESAERIYLRYLLPGAEKEIYLPPSLRMPDFPSSDSTTNPSPLIPDLFHPQKVYIFRALEADAFPRFLRAKAFANLTPGGAFWRLIIGLIILWGAFVTGFSLIFLDYSRRTRIWVLLPFFIAFNLLLAAYYSLSPLLAAFQSSETSPFRTMRVREGYVRRLLAWRAVWIEGVCIVLTAVFTCIFVFVPGHRL